MTKDGKFKRSVRADARQAGANYTEVLSKREAVESSPPTVPTPEDVSRSRATGQRAQFAALVSGKTDEELSSLAEQFGGYRELIERVLEGFQAVLDPGEDAAVGFDLGVGQWRVATRAGGAVIGGSFDATDAVVRMSGADFLRVMGDDLKLAAALAEDRMAVQGDMAAVTRLFGMVSRAAPQEERRRNPALRPPQEALRRVADQLAPGSSVGAVRPLQVARGHGWEVVLEHRGRKLPIVVVRHSGTNAARAARIEFDQLRVLRDHGLLVPDPLLFDEGDLFGLPAVVVTKLDGHPQLTPSDPVAWARGVGETIAAIHRVDPDRVPALVPANPQGPLPPTSRRGAQKHRLGARIWDLVNEYPPAEPTPGLIHGNLQATSVLWRRGRVTGIVDWQHPFVGGVGIDLAEARIGALLVFGPEIAERLRVEYEAARGEPLAEMDKWDLKSVMTFGLGVGIDYWLGHYQAMGAKHLTRPLLERRLDDWIDGILGRADEWARPEHASARPAAEPDDGYRALRDAVVGASDHEIRAFADRVGGFRNLCAAVFDGMRARREREGVANFHVAFVLDNTMAWELKAHDGKVTVAEGEAKRAPAALRCRPADFLRLVTSQLDVDGALADGRLVIAGDVAHVAIALPSFDLT